MLSAGLAQGLPALVASPGAQLDRGFLLSSTQLRFHTIWGHMSQIVLTEHLQRHRVSPLVSPMGDSAWHLALLQCGQVAEKGLYQPRPATLLLGPLPAPTAHPLRALSSQFATCSPWDFLQPTHTHRSGVGFTLLFWETLLRPLHPPFPKYFFLPRWPGAGTVEGAGAPGWACQSWSFPRGSETLLATTVFLHGYFLLIPGIDAAWQPHRYVGKALGSHPTSSKITWECVKIVYASTLGCKAKRYMGKFPNAEGYSTQWSI